MAKTPKHIKIVIDTFMEDDGLGGEGLWARPLGDNLYELDNSPFHTLAINDRDVVRATSSSPDKNPVFVEVVCRGGHRTIHVIFLAEGAAEKPKVLEQLVSRGITYEGLKGNFFAIDLPPHIDFDRILDYLVCCQEFGWLDCRYAPQPQPPGTGEELQPKLTM